MRRAGTYRQLCEGHRVTLSMGGILLYSLLLSLLSLPLAMSSNIIRHNKTIRKPATDTFSFSLTYERVWMRRLHSPICLFYSLICFSDPSIPRILRQKFWPKKLAGSHSSLRSSGIDLPYHRCCLATSHEQNQKQTILLENSDGDLGQEPATAGISNQRQFQ